MSASRTILHPTDFSETAAHALRLAAHLARDLGANLVVLHVAESPAIPADLEAGEAKEKYASMEERIAQLRANDPTLLVHGRVVMGAPVDAILKNSAETKCDLIVMGSHGRTGLGRVWLGSVAEVVARRATCPVLILKGPHHSSGPVSTGADRPRFPTIIVPTDLSKRSRAALKVASSLAEEGTRVIVVHVAGPVHIASEGYMEALEQRIREFSVTAKDVRVEYRLLDGDAAEGILAVASEVEGPLIVISSHGRTGLDRLYRGSVAEKVLRGASCPVLILRGAAGSEPSPTSPAGKASDDPLV